MQIINVIQGSPAWKALRAEHDTASEAPAMMGKSKYMTRSALMDQKATGMTDDVSPAQQAIFDRGHAAEAGARPIAEEIIGEELFPATALDDRGVLLASFDGITMLEDVIWEHKLINSDLRNATAETLDEHYKIQMDQQLLVSGAEKCLFMASNGTKEDCNWFWYTSTPERLEAIKAGWKQFREDLLNHKPRQAEATVVGAAPDALPAIHIELTGMVTASNLAEVREQAVAVFKSINRDLKTDEDFANAEKTVKWCGDIEKRLDAAKEHALAQTASISELFSTIDQIKAEARDTRLALDKQVKAQKEDRKRVIVIERQQALREHCDKLQASIGKIALPPVSADFAGAIKGKRSFSMMEDSLDAELARAKIEANTVADHYRASVEILRAEADGFESLFADAQQIVGKDHDDLRNLIRLRITEHKEAESKRLEAERESIRAEEQAKAEAEAQRKADQERVDREAEARRKENEARATEEGVGTSPMPSQTRARDDLAPDQDAPEYEHKPLPAPREHEVIRLVAISHNVSDEQAETWLAGMTFLVREVA